MFKKWIPVLAATLLGTNAVQARVTLKLATLAPDGSAWMQALERIKTDVAEATGGEVVLRIYPGGVMGSDNDVLYKIKVGQLDGGGFMGGGIGQICPDARVLTMPFTFDSYEEVDAVFEKMRPYIEAKTRENQFEALGWTEVGFSYMLSTVPARSMADMRAAKVWSFPNEPMMAELMAAASISGIPATVTDVLTALQSGLLQVVFSPPYAGVAMQWHTRVKYINSHAISYSYGGLFVSAKSWAKISEPFRAKISEICDRSIRALTPDVRKNNAEALDVMRREGITTIDSTAEQAREFYAMRDRAVEKCVPNVFSREAYDLMMKYRQEFRASKPAAPTP